MKRPLLDQLVKAQNEVDSITARENFILGFRLGVRLRERPDPSVERGVFYTQFK